MTLREQVFRKMGYKDGDWKEDDGSGHGRNNTIRGLVSPDGEYEFEYDDLPELSSQWEVTAKYLVAFIRERGFVYEIKIPFFYWINRELDDNNRWHEAEIKDDNLAEAACKAFMEVEL